MGVPLLHLPPIPGCETRNLQYFAQRGMSQPFLFSDGAVPQILSMLDDSELRRQMCDRQRACIPANAAAGICDLAQTLAAS